ncbi:hypothetical protein FLJC2902T_12760 [Flavobacterium limnosediminis JC2902]|uniref:Uncharacterized protein n=1 Tax=Flavobacterium limnosediminis JC2902 TaxID=1341181 RepID=V6SWA8_9FLAO|nr:hypothetical protein [Flavobacterium limnosediminis]ESU28685.1 hypothetical protein FLJC2902T_12760 [Flavobacterium limnosediminis JC2902]
MNQFIIDKYEIKFEILLVDGRKEIQITSDVIPYFRGYFIKKYPEFLLEEVLPEINKAVAGQSFDEDGGGVYHFLRIGETTSHFYTDEGDEFPIPTSDLKEILLSYIEWITENNLENNI